MIEIDYIDVMGWEHTIRGCRNPMNSWARSDSWFWDGIDTKGRDFFHNINDEIKSIDMYKESELLKDFVDKYKVIVGPNDLDLMMRLAKGGSTHAKYRRMIVVYMDITAPLYWWKEFDTYKVGTVANSCSTMHKIHAKKFDIGDFSYEHLTTNEPIPCSILSSMEFLKGLIGALNKSREMFLETKDKKWWWQMIQLLPSSYNQKRTVMLNYDVLSHMYHDRKDHKLDEWRNFCEMIEGLPYSQIITMKGEPDGQ